MYSKYITNSSIGQCVFNLIMICDYCSNSFQNVKSALNQASIGWTPIQSNKSQIQNQDKAKFDKSKSNQIIQKSKTLNPKS